MLNKSRSPKVIIVSSSAGSIGRMAERTEPPPPMQYYGSSKAAANFLTVYYSKKYPSWKVNAVDPGRRATAMSKAKVDEETDPALGAVRVTELVKEGPGGVTGTYSQLEGPMLW